MTNASEFKVYVKINKFKRYELIDESKGSEITEEQARELSEQQFKAAIKENLPYYERGTAQAHYIGG
jgi:hypothetical protein